MNEIKMLGKMIIRGKLHVITGLAIGGSGGRLEIGGVDKPVIRDPQGRPYVPGSSLKGKMRSLLEKAQGKTINTNLGDARIHTCKENTDYLKCSVCRIFGLPGERAFSEPTRLLVRDSLLTEDSQRKLKELRTDLEFTEIKFENAIDRITSVANPRQMERVPAGAEFTFEMVYNIFDEKDKENLKEVFVAMELLENDYLGSSGSRGYGKIKFDGMELFWNSKDDYEKGTVEGKKSINGEHVTVAQIMQHFPQVMKMIT